jgi:hypothetical protein
MKSFKSIILLTVLLICSASSSAGELPFAGAPEGAASFGPMIGDHNCVMIYRGQDGEMSEKSDCRWHWYYKFEGHMVQDDFYMLDGQGKVVWSGSTLRTWDLAENRWNNMFLGVHGTGFGKLFHGKPVGEEVHVEVSGTGPDGKDYIDKITYYEMKDGEFRWRQERSFDQGNSWQLWVTVESV